MNEKLQAYFEDYNSKSEHKEKELRDEILIEEGLYEIETVEDDKDYDHVEYDAAGYPIFYKYKPFEVTDEEFAKIKEINDSKYKIFHTQSNGVATVLKVIAWLTYILGFFAGIAACAEINKYSSDAGGTTVLFTWWAAAFISGSLFLGFAEIINLLNDIKHK